MVSFKNFVALTAALLPFVAAVPVDHPGKLKIREMDKRAEVIPGRYIVVFEPSTNASTVEAHEASIVALKKRDVTADVDNTYAVEEFKGYSITTDEATIAEIAASPEVSHIIHSDDVLANSIPGCFRRA